MAILVFAGVLSVPSAVFADASWYGALKGGLQVGGGEDAKIVDGGSRWGVKGSAEAGEGLTAVYRFEHKISTTNAGQPEGRLAYVGLTGGFGSLTLGQIWNAAYNHAGAITDQSYYFGNAGTGYRHGNALSYAYSAGAVGFQLDLISDGGSDSDTGKAVDKTEFGMTIGLGEIGKVAIAHTNQRDTMKTGVTNADDVREATDDTYWVRTAETGNPGGSTEAKMITVYITGAQNIADNVADGKLTTAGVELIQRTGDRYHATGALATECTTLAADTDATNDCVTATAFVSVVTTETVAAGGGEPEVTTTEDYHLEGAAATNVVKTPGMAAVAPVPGKVLKDLGHKTTHVAVQFSVGGISPYIGFSEKKMNGATAKTKTTHYGMSGSLGDTGMSYLLMARSVKNAEGKKSTPWVANVSRSLGGGATVIFEHGNADDGKSGQSRLGLHVNF